MTGARHGIGRAVAVALARAGADVVVAGRRTDDVEEAVEDIRRAGCRALPVGFDVRNAGEIEAALAKTLETFHRLDIVVNNAGITVRRPALELTEGEWNEVIATNLTGTFLVSRVAARAMAEKGGRIINLSSTFARSPLPGRAAYAASKAGVEQLTRVLAREWAPAITVNAIAPTSIATETRAAVFSDPAVLADRIAGIPLGRLEVADDLVGALLLLSGPAGAFITGQTLIVDGGYSLG